nr:RloB family protein [Odoribacter splanchnicus]
MPIIHEPVEAICKILIVCEGSKTEPNYFGEFNKKKRGLYVFDLEFSGGGISTKKVVEEAIELKKQADMKNDPYDRVWAVFDKDDFPDADFNAAILKAESNHIGCAWSNEAFELWYLLHFHNRVTPMSRTEYKNAISNAVNDSPFYKGKKEYVYKKNDPKNYSIMNKYGSQDSAIKNALAMERCYTGQSFATHNPCTKVHEIVLQLMGKDEKLNKEISEKMNQKLD